MPCDFCTDRAVFRVFPYNIDSHSVYFKEYIVCGDDLNTGLDNLTEMGYTADWIYI